MVGRTLSHYRIVDRLGAGGMGEVYRARDLKLDRDVALKVLPEGSLTDENARARFRKEALALSRLSHPHVAHLLDFDSEDGTDFLVMDLVSGPSLEERLREGPLPEREVLRLGAQLARGLHAAHEQGVVHRDLKPSNLHLTPDGLLKILDFGLARLLQPDLSPPGQTTATETAAGAIVGSPPYMAPEQLLGRPPDERTDVYSAGAVLYEMATGQRPFGSRSGVALTDAILHERPRPPREVNGSISPGLEAAILKALDKDPGLRHQSAQDLLVDLERLQQRQNAAPDRPWRRRLPIVGLSAAIATTGAATAWFNRPTSPPRITDAHVLAMLTPHQTGWGPGKYVATDGERLYAVTKKGGRNVLRQVLLSGGDPVDTALPFPGDVFVLAALPGTSTLILAGSHEGLDASSADEGWPLWRVPAPAGAPQRIGDLLGTSVDVSPDGRSVALTRGRTLVLASIDGSNARERHRLTRPAHGVRWSPDGRRLRYQSRGPGGDDAPWVWEIPVTTGPPRALWSGFAGDWTGDGRHYVFVRPPTDDLFVAGESSWSRWRSVDALPLSSGPLGYSFLGSSADGRRLVASFAPRSAAGRGTLMRYDPKRKLFEPALGVESAFYAQPSPDGEWLAWVRYPEGTLWRSRPDGSERMQLTSRPAVAHLPEWSPDGTRIVFASQPDPSRFAKEIRVVAADGSESGLVAESPTDGDAYWQPCWLSDGSIVFSRTGPPNPGILRYDPVTRQVEGVRGAEAFMYPRCAPTGDLLAVALGDARTHWMLRKWGDAAWHDLGTFPHVYPEWTHDGRSICALSPVDERIDCLDVARETMTTLADTSTLELAVWTEVPWMGLDAEDRPLVTVASGQTWTVYALDWETP